MLVHGRVDLGGPPEVAWRITRPWPGSELAVIETAGHISDDLVSAVVAATDRFASRR